MLIPVVRPSPTTANELVKRLSFATTYVLAALPASSDGVLGLVGNKRTTKLQMILFIKCKIIMTQSTAYIFV